jgi:hypothetical protein
MVKRETSIIFDSGKGMEVIELDRLLSVLNKKEILTWSQWRHLRRWHER